MARSRDGLVGGYQLPQRKNEMIGWIRSLFRPETKEETFARLYSVFHEECRRDDMDSAAIADEYALRRVFVRTRRIVSERTLKQPHRYREYLEATIQQEGRILQAYNKKLGFAYLKLMKGFNAGDILHPAALEAHNRAGNSLYVGFQPDRDSIAAVSTGKAP